MMKLRGLKVTFITLRDEKFSESLRILLSSTCRRSIGKPEISLELAKSLSSQEILAVSAIRELFDKIETLIN